MSIRVMSKVWEVAPFSDGTLLVLLALADWADEDGRCFPKVEQLAKKARLTHHGAQFCLRRLVNEGAITVEEESSGPGKPRVYRLAANFLDSKRGAVTEPIIQKRGAVIDQKGCSNRPRNKEEPSLTVIKPPTPFFEKRNSKPADPFCPDASCEVCMDAGTLPDKEHSICPAMCAMGKQALEARSYLRKVANQ